MNLNKVILIGRLTRDPQLRYTPQGTAVAEMGLAVNRSFTDGSGQKREETCFVEVVMWQKQAETCAKYLRKGSPIFVEGRLSFDSWEGNDGQRRSRLRVVAEGFQFMDSPQDRRAREGSAAAGVEPVPEPAVPEGPADQPAGGPASDIPF
jgi:single-strand DNA-binding protein